MDEDEKLIRGIVKKFKMPDDVDSVDLQFSEDSSGVPAVWINLHVKNDNEPSAAKIAGFTAIKRSISREILSRSASRWPYVRLVTD